MLSFLEFRPSVLAALQAGKPVVALESTIISHGMPYPENLETALKVEAIVRENGAEPATIALMNGKLKVGLSAAEIEVLGRAGLQVTKASRRDLAVILSQKTLGATTVSATMLVAALAGIRVFATGGIGGVHRNAAQTFDISADLQELAQTPVAVVCAGVKSILDIGLTLEYLETHGVPILGFQTSDFPAFFTRKSGFSVDFCCENEFDLAQILKTQWAMGLKTGALVANPVPQEFEADADQLFDAINKALRRSVKQKIQGKHITPFLLSEIEKATGGSSLKTNIQLVLSNAALAARLAVEMAR
jgi:pseudouridylate synthase